jgi:hypothetical protein
MNFNEWQPNNDNILNKIDLNLDKVRQKLLSAWLAQSASVERTSGEVEHDWAVIGVFPKGIVVAKRDNDSIQKMVTLKDFAELNPELFIELEY